MPKAKMYLCTYCGREGDEDEHVIPLSYLGERRLSKENGQWVVQSCRTCNQLGCDSIFFTIPDKAQFILSEYQRKYRKVLGTPNWSDDELADLSYELRTMIEGHITAKSILIEKIKHLEMIGGYGDDYLMPDFIKSKYKEWKDGSDNRPKQMIRVYQYAKEKNVTIQTVYRWIREGKIKNFKRVKRTIEKIYIEV